MVESIAALLAHDHVRAARAHIERADEATLGRQAALSAIPAPTGAEAARGARVAEMLDEAGLQDVKVDEVGNVRAWHGSRERGAGSVVLSAHLDTVFGPELDVSVSRRGARLEGPGIADNARGLAALVAIGEALVRARVETQRPVLFAATVGEEGSGDLLGVRHLFDGPVRPHAFIALDGAGIERIVHRALGARRYHVTYCGPGGHSWAAFGRANPANAVGRAIALIADIPTHGAPRTAHSVVRLGGGTSLNSIPQTAWLDVDLRSEEPHALEKLDGAVHAILTQALEEENRHRVPGTAPLTVDIRCVGDRPSGLTPRTHPLVQAAVAATRAVGHEHQLACASTDANVPIALGVPAVALGGGGRSGDAHLPTEWYENDKGALGIVRALLVTAATAEAI
ncbi:MAG TPA: M20/M25/M40 family metallo-hydrolase [Gemmatimonadales bacterium]|jgi:acetylornithine deacetylase/succinyl-diaminopimelate desuccinylase-like protein|nr:M20/M25/M40 family metallo-hydrolase [Gemmatimonadales bacterium]